MFAHPAMAMVYIKNNLEHGPCKHENTSNTESVGNCDLSGAISSFEDLLSLIFANVYVRGKCIANIFLAR